MVLNLPLDECIDNTHMKVIREKRKRKETNKKKLQQAIQSQPKGKEQDNLKKTSLGPLRQGQRLDTSETKQSSSKECKPPKQKLEQPQRAPPAHMQAPPEPMQLPLDECMQTTGKQGSCNNFSSHRSDRSPPPVRPVPNFCTGPAL
jgi:hypothetical protein